MIRKSIKIIFMKEKNIFLIIYKKKSELINKYFIFSVKKLKIKNLIIYKLIFEKK